MAIEQDVKLLDTPVAVKLADRSKDWLKSKLRQLIPDDNYVPLKVMLYKENGSRNIINTMTDNSFSFVGKGFTQFLKLLHPNLSKRMVDQLSPKIRTALINDLIIRNVKGYASKREDVLFRCKPTANRTKVFATFSSNYTAVNHIQLVDNIQSLMEGVPDKVAGEIRWSASLDKMHIRLPLSKVSTHGKGVYSGVELSNSQAGSSMIDITSMIWELICSNGMISIYDHSTFMHRKHTGNVGNLLEGFKDWYVNEKGMLRNNFDSLNSFNFHDINHIEKGEFVAGAYKSSLQLLKDNGATDEFLMLLTTANAESKKIHGDKWHDISGWDFVRNITEISQHFPKKRYDIDRWAGIFVKNLWELQ